VMNTGLNGGLERSANPLNRPKKIDAATMFSMHNASPFITSPCHFMRPNNGSEARELNGQRNIKVVY